MSNTCAPTPSQLRAVFFDWSGTLADDLGPVIEATNAVLTHHGVEPLNRESFREQFRLPYTEFYEELLPGVSLEDLESIFRSHHENSDQKTFLLPGAIDMLEWCQAQELQIFLCSSVHEDGWQQQAKELSVHHFFDHAYTGVRDKVADFGSFLEEQGLQAHQTVFLGDMRHDIEAAQAHGVPSIGLTHGYESKQKLESVNPDYLCEELAEARGVIMALMNPWQDSKTHHQKIQQQETQQQQTHPLPITIHGLWLETFLGVPEQERAQAQGVEVDVHFSPQGQASQSWLDEMEATVDYAQVAQLLTQEALSKPRKLAETLAKDLGQCLLRNFPIQKASICLRKFILPNAKAVEVTWTCPKWRL